MKPTIPFILSVSLFGFLDLVHNAPGQDVMTVAALPGVPIAHEPHHHLVFQNPFVNVYEVEVAPGDATRMHQHYYDNLFVVFGDADLTNAVAGKKPAILDLPDSGVHFSREPYTHVITNNGKLPFRNVTVELLQTQGELKAFSPSINSALDKAPTNDDGIREGRVLETDEIQATAVAVRSSVAWSPPHDEYDRLVILLDKINDGSGPIEKNSPFPAGMLVWLPAGSEVSLPNESDQEMKLMVLKFKDTPREIE